jgi:hypothetical protein
VRKNVSKSHSIKQLKIINKAAKIRVSGLKPSRIELSRTYAKKSTKSRDNLILTILILQKNSRCKCNATNSLLLIIANLLIANYFG